MKKKIIIYKTETVEEYRARMYGPQPLPPPKPRPTLTAIPIKKTKLSKKEKKLLRKAKKKDLMLLSKHQLIDKIAQLENDLRIARTSINKIKNKNSPVFNTFYNSSPWQDLRYRVLKKYGRICALCKNTDGRMHVDHIKPRSLHPELALVFDNLQVLCEACNLGKSNRDDTDFRTQPLSKN